MQPSSYILACNGATGVRSTWLQLTKTLGANTESQNKRRCDRVPLVGGNAVPQRYWICSRSSQVLAERRDQISNGITTEAGTSLCTQPNDNRFDRATHRERAEETRTSLTERVRRNYTGQSSNDFLCVLSVFSLLAISNYFDERETKLIRRAPPAAGSSMITRVHSSTLMSQMT
jgi:hypothetical protein